MRNSNYTRRKRRNLQGDDEPYNRDTAHGYGSVMDPEDFEYESYRESEHFVNDDEDVDDRFVNEGYSRRRNNQPNPFYTDNYTYDPSRYEEGRNRISRNPENYDPYNPPEQYDQGYDYYESYPRYNKTRAQAEPLRRSEDHLVRRSRRRRPNIRDKYW
jgi:hypothetical protein